MRVTAEEFGVRHLGKTEYLRLLDGNADCLVLVVNLDGTRWVYETADFKDWNLVYVGGLDAELKKMRESA